MFSKSEESAQVSTARPRFERGHIATRREKGILRRYVVLVPDFRGRCEVIDVTPGVQPLPSPFTTDCSDFSTTTQSLPDEVTFELAAGLFNNTQHPTPEQIATTGEAILRATAMTPR